MKFHFGLFVAVSLVAASAFASSSELIVRLRDSQNTVSQARKSVVTELGRFTGKVQIVNGSEGVLKLSFANEDLAVAARQVLAHSADVLNVTANQLYRPAIKYSFEPLRAKARDFFRGLPFPFPGEPKSNFRAEAPEVQLPPTVVQSGPDPMIAQDWSWNAVGMDRVGNVHADSKMIVAVTDTGVDYNHEDLISGMYREAGNPKIVGWDTAHDHAKPFDIVHFDLEGCGSDPRCWLLGQQDLYLTNPGHGTHCAGHIGAVANNAKGIAGMGNGAQIQALKFFYDFGETNAGQGDDAAAVKAIDWAIQHGAKIISASWGGYMTREEAEKSEIKQAIIRAQQAGALFIVAAGNGDQTGKGIDQDTAASPSYPAAYELDNVITVAATDSADQLGTFSNYGARSVHIGAPGVKIFSTTSGGGYSDTIGTLSIPILGEQVINWDGTSMATPIVAGAAALVWSQHPTENYRQIRDRILRTARQVPALQGKVSSGGILDVAAAIK